jgi:hypothetical protein
MFGRRLPRHLVPVHPDNVVNKDWVILLEAGTIVVPLTAETPRREGNAGAQNRESTSFSGRPATFLRSASTTQEPTQFTFARSSTDMTMRSSHR